jgi:diguanylate cyclase (GGDEF)-like protein
MLDQLRYHVSRYSRNRISFVILLIDLDNFKDINDTYGHDVGDHVLREVGEDLRRAHAARIWYRAGGEEFLILLPDTDISGGRVLAERVSNGREGGSPPDLQRCI